ncbi:MAG: isoprenyl transferase [Candidatus Aminicenantes bacterium]|nr:isoprenyl transferase [Candidatus Aminicenantes bacterium]
MKDALKEFIKPGSKEEALVNKIDFSRLPQHVAVIMDGNGRWAKKRNKPRVEGHKAGSKAVQEVVETCSRMGIKYLTLYAFSKENWKRPKKEVRTLWELLFNYLRKESNVLMENKFRLNVIGDIEQIPKKARKELTKVIHQTREYDRFTINLALNYSGRSEIVDAVKKIMDEERIHKNNVDEDLFSRYLYTSGIPDPDLLIRTSGELRISNFLLWQIAYSEIWVTPVFWPDFSREHMLEAIVDYQERERRFGDIKPKQ